MSDATAPMTAPSRTRHAEILARATWWQRLGYHSKQAEFVLYFLGVSGLLLWDGVSLPWGLVRTSLVAHVLAGLLLFPVVVLPFWLSHRGLLARSHKPFLRATGRVIEVALVLAVFSGVYLLFIGNRGEPVGNLAYWLHLLPSVPFVALVYVHAKRWSMLKALKWLVPLLVALAAVAAPALAAVESGSLLLGAQGTRLYSANFDTGTVSWLDRENGERLAEVGIGGDVRRIALNEAEHLLAATDYTGGRVAFIDTRSAEQVGEVAVPGRPFGIVYDARNDLYWVAAFEGARLVAVRPGEGVVHDLPVAETPRGLALLSDGRLLVSHAMTGEVSVHDTTVLPPPRINVIRLHETQKPTETDSQGVPRLLDDIAVSPAEDEAWLPHVLWNFDHPFQFQSTVFPAVSVLSLKEKGAEHEVPDRRKQLFEQINIIDENNRTRIVSNPHDAAFSADGQKVYVTLAGSEDVMAFDLTRRKPLDDGKERRARRKGKLSQGGAKVMQIYRHTPGDNPRGLVVDGQDIYVQNAMSLDLVHMTRGGTGPFARMRVVEERFAALVREDPVPADLRRGKRLFHSGNTDDFPETPMAGDFWMSCQSCHVDGFNFTNGYLFRDTPADRYEDARVGHANLGAMIAGDFVADYVRIIRDTQGGMGADDRDGAIHVDPDDPPVTVQEMMTDLHQVVIAKGNLPYLSTWLRLDDDRRMVHEKEWVNSAACAECHSDMFDQWADSLHRLMGDSNPYYNVTEDVAAAAEGEEFRVWCMGCHMPQSVLSGVTKTADEGHMFERGGTSLFEALDKGEPDLDEGTGCLFCHRITKLEDARGQGAGGNASFTVNVKDRERYVFENSDSPLLDWIGNRQINAKPEVHAKSYSQPFYTDSELCGSCHNEFAPGTGSVIVDTFGEWQASPFNDPGNPDKHRSCIDCHMHGDITKIGEDVPGISTDGGEVKDNVVTHQFTGANYHLVGLRNEKLREMSIQLLQSAAELETRLDPDKGLVVRVKNVGAGHALPTGVADFRQMWLDVTVRDADGTVVLQSGRMDDNGVVPEDARMFQKVFGDRDGNPVGLHFWRYEKMLKDTKIPAGGYRDEAFALPPDVALPLDVDVKLMFRTYPQWVTDAVRERYPEMPEPDAIVMTELATTLEHP